MLDLQTQINQQINILIFLRAFRHDYLLAYIICLKDFFWIISIEFKISLRFLIVEKSFITSTSMELATEDRKETS